MRSTLLLLLVSATLPATSSTAGAAAAPDAPASGPAGGQTVAFSLTPREEVGR